MTDKEILNIIRVVNKQDRVARILDTVFSILALLFLLTMIYVVAPLLG